MSTGGYLFRIIIAHLVCCYKLSITMESTTSYAQKTSCTCLGHVITYECTVRRGTGTIWRGNAFNCASSTDEINLLESGIVHAPATCNDGAITGRVIHNAGAFYTSQLSVTVSSNLIGKNVSCIQDDGSTVKTIGSSVIILTTTVPYTPPQTPSLIYTDLSLRYTTFSWTSVAPDCPTVHYDILASNCGSCPTTTNHTNVTCTDIPTDGSTCIFSIRVVICGNITGNESDAAQGVFKGSIVNSGCVGAIASASIFVIGLTISVIVFTTVIIVLIKANKRARRIELAARRRARLSRYEENPGASHDQPPRRRTMEAESTFNTSTTIYDDMDYEIAKVAVIATNKNIAYADTVMGQTEPNVKEHDVHEYAQIHQSHLS